MIDRRALLTAMVALGALMATSKYSEAETMTMTTDTIGGTSTGNMARTVRRRNSQGNARERSVKERTIRSNQPPMRPAALPNIAAMMLESSEAAGASN